jgi:hypothetical protein
MSDNLFHVNLFAIDANFDTIYWSTMQDQSIILGGKWTVIVDVTATSLQLLERVLCEFLVLSIGHYCHHLVHAADDVRLVLAAVLSTA